MASKKRISKLTGKPVRPYKKRGAKAEKKESASVVRGGTRAGAGRKSSEVHFAQLNAKVDTTIELMGILAEQIGVDPAKLAALVEKKVAAKQTIPASADRGQAHSQAVAHDAAVMQKAAEPTPTAPVAPVAAAPMPVTNGPGSINETTTEQPVKRKPGRPRKIVTAAPPAPPAPEQPAAPVAPIPAPVAVAPVVQPVAAVQVAPVAPQVPAQPTWPLQQPQQVQPIQTAPAPQFIPAPVQQPVAPVTFSPPPPPPPVAPQFAVGVAPLNVQPVAPTQAAPQAPGGVDFEAQFQNMQNGATNQPK